MVGLEQLTTHIYHENQEPGSALCAQHALNSLLQGNCFTPSDLSTIARSLDTLEEHVDRGRLGQESANMDDTGFFSIQVLETALNVWGQSLIRWRSEAMQPYHDRPQNQRAFILNCDQHWFTLRRFGNPEGVGPWFNLDSSLERPKWVSETYLGVWLQQAESDGYSTFAVVPTDPDHPLPQTDADDIATRVSQPVSSPSLAQDSFGARIPDSSSTFEDEDFQLQAALHASLDGGAGRFPLPRPHGGPFAGETGTLSPSTSTGFPTPPLFAVPPPVPAPSTRPTGQPMTNPVAASMARNQVMLDRMRREQEAALREHYHEEVSGFDNPPNTSYSAVGNRVQDEEEQLRRAIAESEAMAHEQGHAESVSNAAGAGISSGNTQAERWTQDRTHSGRVYDDEDAEFQAALQASLESAPPGAHTFDTATTTSSRASTARDSPAFIAGSRAESLTGADEDEDGDGDGDDADAATEETLSETAEAPQAEDPNIEEMRRRRLARFGGP
ncbi:Josephin-domain-containing protein [Russula compacta]|nr:Josephin-domain-containing protein [Russula compacta]